MEKISSKRKEIILLKQKKKNLLKIQFFIHFDPTILWLKKHSTKTKIDEVELDDDCDNDEIRWPVFIMNRNRLCLNYHLKNCLSIDQNLKFERKKFWSFKT